jgi:hypothetical protein
VFAVYRAAVIGRYRSGSTVTDPVTYRYGWLGLQVRVLVRVLGRPVGAEQDDRQAQGLQVGA